MKRRTYIAGMVGLGLGGFVTGCDGNKGSGGSGAPAAEWRVGVYLSLSGPQTQFGQDTREGIELAVDEVNKAGGVRGKPIKLLVEDDKSNPNEANNKVLQLIDRDKVVALLGEVASSISKACGIVANKKKIPMITPSSTNPDVTKVGPFAFRVCFTDDIQGQAAAHFVADTLKKKRVAILFATDNLYSAGLAGSFRDEAKKVGLEVVAEKGFLNSETNFTTYITELRDASPDLIYAPIYYNAMIPVARQAKAAGVKGDMFLGSDGWDSGALLKDAGEEMAGAYLTDHFAVDSPLPASQAFAKAYQARYGHDPSALAAQGYDAARLLADAIGRAKGDTPEAIRDAIADTKAFPGATGSITINAERNADKPIVLVQIAGGKFSYRSTLDTKAVH
jgi:branched-chain amino acid transport system substrate-binding protein